MKRLFVLLMIAGLFSGCAEPKPPKVVVVETPTIVDWPPGTVFVSNNKDTSLNLSPGTENHLAMYVGNGEIIESQVDQGVISTPFSVYKARAYDWFPEFPIDVNVGGKAAARAKTLVGLPYRELSSLLSIEYNELKGLNCVSVVRISYAYALGHKLRELRKPDDILTMTDIFTRNWKGYQIFVPKPVAPGPDVAVPTPIKKAA